MVQKLKPILERDLNDTGASMLSKAAVTEMSIGRVSAIPYRITLNGNQSFTLGAGFDLRFNGIETSGVSGWRANFDISKESESTNFHLRTKEILLVRLDLERSPIASFTVTLMNQSGPKGTVKDETVSLAISVGRRENLLTTDGSVTITAGQAKEIMSALAEVKRGFESAIKGE